MTPRRRVLGPGATAEGLWGLTADERARLQREPLSSWTSEDWLEFASRIQNVVFEDYEAGEVQLGEVLRIVRASSLGCAPIDRIAFLVLAVERALNTAPRARKTRRAQYAPWKKRLAGALVRGLADDWRGVERLVPTTYSESSPVLDKALEWLEVVGVFTKPPKPKTLYRWYLEHVASMGEPRPRGRPLRMPWLAS